MSTIAQIDERVQSTLDDYTESWRAAQEKFVVHFANNPEYAIEWLSDDVVKAQAKHVVALNLAERPDGMDLAEAVTHQIASLEREIRHEGGRSTSPYANANYLFAREAKVAVLDRLEQFADAYSKAEAV